VCDNGGITPPIVTSATDGDKWPVSSFGRIKPGGTVPRCTLHMTGWPRGRSWRYIGNTHVFNAVFWDVTPCGSCKNRSFGGIYRLRYQGEKNTQAKSNVSSSKHLKLIRFTLMMESICSSETLVLTRARWRHIQEEGFLHSYCLQNPKCCIRYMCWPYQESNPES
jgi:hypothetical protein